MKVKPGKGFLHMYEKEKTTFAWQTNVVFISARVYNGLEVIITFCQSYQADNL